jgi:D-alanyl-D-alanine carboxypeptidase (penicillin-binding protein 5/6)
VFADSSTSQAVGQPPQISAQTAAVIDAKTMQVYYQKNMHQQMYPASITKIMTGLLAAEKGEASKVVTVSEDVGNSEGKSVSCIGLVPGEQITQDSLMYTMFLASANDSAYVLAENIGGTVDNFVGMMNARAKQLGATNTHFDNPNGLPDTNNYTSAYDMALISREAINTPGELKYFGAVNQTVPADNVRTTPVQYGTIVNMLRPDSKYYYPGIIAAKSGWIEMSGYTLVAVAQRDGRTVISVQMGGNGWSTIYRDAAALLNYGFEQPQAVVAAAPVNDKNGVATASNRTALKSMEVKDGENDKQLFISLLIAVIAVICVGA